MQIRPGAARFARARIRFFCLTENFRFAHDHRIEPRGYAEKMLHAFLPFITIKHVVFAAVRFTREITGDGFCRNSRCGSGVDFNAITCRKQDRFSAAVLFEQRTIDHGTGRVTFARFYVCGVMAHADAKKIHQTGYFCETKVIPQSNEIAMLNAKTQSAATRFGASRRRWRACKIAA